MVTNMKFSFTNVPWYEKVVKIWNGGDIGIYHSEIGIYLINIS